ncbi:MAG: hypothetical protein K0R67_289 [Paenibacillus sp.]|jgi:transcription elongation factor GreA|nr:hypothetical protein [Paenibacillus sp.]
MSHRISIPIIREQLIRQLVLLCEEKNHFLDTFFLMHGKERMQMDQLLTAYTGFVENLLKHGDDELHRYVLIGSQVAIMNLDDHTEDVFTIVFPDYTDPDENRISFLSPLGKQLLFAATGSVVKIDTPIGIQRMMIEHIEFVSSQDSQG